MEGAVAAVEYLDEAAEEQGEVGGPDDGAEGQEETEGWAEAVEDGETDHALEAEEDPVASSPMERDQALGP